MPTDWRTSSYTNPQASCVELATWRKSSFSGAGNDCIELAIGASSTSEEGDMLGVRDTKNRTGGTLLLPDAARDQLTAFARRH